MQVPLSMYSSLARRILDIYWTVYSREFRPGPGEKDAFRQDFLDDFLTPADIHEGLLGMCRFLGTAVNPRSVFRVGDVCLPQPHILAGGWIKGRGFESEAEALDGIETGCSFLPGWRVLPLLAGPIEYGSFNRWPRTAPAHMGYPPSYGNPGIRAASEFLARNRAALPSAFGLNLSPPPVPGPVEETQLEIEESISIAESSGLEPTWITLNLAHLMDAPGSQEDIHTLTRAACKRKPEKTPLWLKVSPNMTARQGLWLLDMCDACGVQAIVATDVHFQTDRAGKQANISGTLLAPLARRAQIILSTLKRIHGHRVDIVACGGISKGRDLVHLRLLGIKAWQYHTALMDRGPLAGPLIRQEDADLREKAFERSRRSCGQFATCPA